MKEALEKNDSQLLVSKYKTLIKKKKMTDWLLFKTLTKKAWKLQHSHFPHDDLIFSEVSLSDEISLRR